LRVTRNRIIVASLTALLVFLALWEGNIWIQERTVMQPLERSLKSLSGVTDVTCQESSSQVTVSVRLASVPDLFSTYSDIEKTVKRFLGKKSFVIQLQDHRTPALEEAYYNIHFDVQEAIATGGFARMADAVSKKVKAMGLDRYRIFVGPMSVYVQLHQGGDYLYEIVPRPESIQAKAQEPIVSFGSVGMGGSGT